MTEWLGRRPVAPPATADARVAGIETRLLTPLPPAFRHYLCHAAPPATHRDMHGTDWWSLDRIERMLSAAAEGEGAAEGHHRWLAFADWAAWGWTWAIQCGEGAERGAVALVDGVDRLVVADSFDAFVLLALPGRALRRAHRACQGMG